MKLQELAATLVLMISPCMVMAASASDVSCPQASYIHLVPLAETNNMGSNDWFVAATNQKYGTEQTWRFGTIVKANSEGEAISQANAMLSTFQYESGPTYYPPARGWICYYVSASGHKANAVGR